MSSTHSIRSVSTMQDVHPDLVRERKKATFKKEDLTYLIYGSREKYERKKYLLSLFKDDPMLTDRKELNFLSREELCSFMVKQSIYFQRRFKELNITDRSEQVMIEDDFYPNILHLFSLHFGLFITTIESMGTEQQVNDWIPRARNLEIIGAYAQTELGHGTYVRGLETTATYDEKTEEFVLNSPTRTSAKWWIGGLGINATHCILMAQLYSQGKCHGIHPFIVQVRSVEDHRPLPGVRVGDIGPKMTLHILDNGFLYLDHVRIPRNHLLMKYCEIQKDGTYIAKQDKKLFYGSMMYMRALVIINSYHMLSPAITIAIRYSAVRRQTKLHPSQNEEQILDFQTQQYKLFTILSRTFALFFTGYSALDTYNEVFSDLNEEKELQLQALHALLAGLKAISTWGATDSIKICREACGGHGFSNSSGLPQLQCLAAASCTYEGENTVMLLQTGRYLLKCAQNLSEGAKLYGTVSYLGEDFNMGHSQVGGNLHLPALLRLYQHSSQIMLMRVFQQFSNRIASGSSFGEVWNMASVDITKCAQAHCQIYPVEKFMTCVNEIKKPELKSVMSDLCKLYCVHGIIENLGNFTGPGLLTETQASELNSAMLGLLAKIRPNAVTIVDAFDFSDSKLSSALGRYDGQVYEAIYDFAMNSPLNKTNILTPNQDIRHLLKERRLKANL